MSSSTIALLAIIISSLFWSSAGVAAKMLLKIFDPFPGAFWRFFFAAVIILPFLLRDKKIRLKNLLIQVLPVAALSGVNIALYYFGLQKTTANSAFLIYMSIPLISLILARILIAEPLNIKKLTGILVGLFGVIIISVLPSLEKKLV